MTEELKDCPFCNGRAAEYMSGIYKSSLPNPGWYGRTTKFYIMCEDCDCRTSEEDILSIAIKAWNKRA